jgi:hypothetical protein
MANFRTTTVSFVQVVLFVFGATAFTPQVGQCHLINPLAPEFSFKF